MNGRAHRQYSQVQIKTANKGKLIVLLYQGAVRFLLKAAVQLEGKDMEGKGNSLIRAQDIVLELMYALDQKLLDMPPEERAHSAAPFSTSSGSLWPAGGAIVMCAPASALACASETATLLPSPINAMRTP